MVVLYQTVEARITYLSAPIKCVDTNAWLGKGYYFWENNINSAHWWGRLIKKKSDLDYEIYCIPQEKCSCFDLLDNQDHIKLLFIFDDVMKAVVNPSKPSYVSTVIEFIRKWQAEEFPFDCSRALGNIIPKNTDRYLYFSEVQTDFFGVYLNAPNRNDGYQVQVCYYTLDSLHLQKWELIFPEAIG